MNVFSEFCCSSGTGAKWCERKAIALITKNTEIVLLDLNMVQVNQVSCSIPAGKILSSLTDRCFQISRRYSSFSEQISSGTQTGSMDRHSSAYAVYGEDSLYLTIRTWSATPVASEWWVSPLVSVLIGFSYPFVPCKCCGRWTAAGQDRLVFKRNCNTWAASTGPLNATSKVPLESSAYQENMYRWTMR
jgi:hypothetical protein